MPYKDKNKQRDANREWARKHKIQSAERSAKWHLEHREYHIKQVQKWREAHPDRPKPKRTEYQRNYMKEYRKTHRQRINEIGRLENHRRKRELSTNVILNSWFAGSQLHHLSSDVAAYIPKELHGSVPHNLKKGSGMGEINKRAINFVYQNIYK